MKQTLQQYWCDYNHKTSVLKRPAKLPVPKCVTVDLEYLWWVESLAKQFMDEVLVNSIKEEISK